MILLCMLFINPYSLLLLLYYFSYNFITPINKCKTAVLFQLQVYHPNRLVLNMYSYIVCHELQLHHPNIVNQLYCSRINLTNPINKCKTAVLFQIQLYHPDKLMLNSCIVSVTTLPQLYHHQK